MMGFSSVIKNALRLKIYEEDILYQVNKFKPDVCVLIDFPGLHFRLGEKLRKSQFKVVQFVAPKVWAWGQSRVKKFQNSFDKVFGVLPFEEDFFKKHGVDYLYIGSPHYERLSEVVSKDMAELGDFKKWLCFLPGSRESEISGSKGTLSHLVEHLSSDIGIIVPVASNFSVKDICGILEIDPTSQKSRVFFVHDHHYEYMKACDVAFATSGTVTLELALMGVPSVIFYRTSGLKYFLGKRMLAVPFIGLPNLILNKSVFAEFIGPPVYDKILTELTGLLFDVNKRKSVLTDLKKIQSLLEVDPWPNFVRELEKVIK